MIKNTAKTQIFFERLEIIFVVLFMTVSFLQYCCLTFGKTIISYVQWPTILVGGALLLYKAINIKNYFKTPAILLFSGFIISFVVSMVVNFKYGYYENFRGLIFLIFEVFILCAFDIKRNKEFFIKKINIARFYYVVAMFLMSFIGILFMLFGVPQFVDNMVDGGLKVGFEWGRLFGIYWDPNIAAAATVATVVFSFGYLKTVKNKWFKAFNIVNIVVQVLYISFSDSRTGLMTLWAAVTFYLAFALFKSGFKNFKNKVIRWAACLLIVVIASCSIFFVPTVTKNAYNKVVVTISQMRDSKYDADKDTSLIGSEGRNEHVKTDISNRRFDIWGSAVEIFSMSPIVGCSYFNVVSFSEQNIPETYILTNDFAVFSSMHNVIFDILAGQGALGIITFFSAAICIVVFIIKKRKALCTRAQFYFNLEMFTVVIAALVASMFISEVVYVISPLTIIFWLCLGALLNNITTTKEVE